MLMMLMLMLMMLIKWRSTTEYIFFRRLSIIANVYDLLSDILMDLLCILSLPFGFRINFLINI
jgi:hypothetical protein